MTFAIATDFAGIERSLLEWIRVSTGLPCIWAKQTAGRPERPYITLNILADGRQEGQDVEDYVLNGTTEKLDYVTSGDRAMTVELTCYSEKATAAGQTTAKRYLQQAVAALRSNRVYNNILFPAGLGFRQQLSDMNDLSEQLGDRWEERFQVDLEFGYTLVVTDKSETDEGTTYIETVQTTEMTYP